MHSATGNFTWAETDIPMPDGLLRWGRTYNSLDEREERGGRAKLFGRGWTATHEASLEPGRNGDVLFHDGDGRTLRFVLGRDGTYRRPQDLDADLTRADDGHFELRHFCGELWLFNDAGRLERWLHEGRSVSFEYAGGRNGRLTALVLSAGRRLDLDYGGHGRVTRVRADDGRQVTYAYEDGLLSTVTGPDGAVTRYVYEKHRRLESVIDPDGVTLLTNVYDDSGRVIGQGLAGAGGLKFAYDGTTTTVTRTPLGDRTVYEHNTEARVTGLTNALGQRSTYAYNGDGRLTEATTPSGTRIERSYDAAGNTVAETWAGATTRWEFDEEHRRIRQVDPAGRVTVYEYRGSSRIPVRVIGHTGAETRYTVRDGLVLVRADDGGATRYDYDGRRNLIAVTDPEGRRTRYAYDAAGRRTEITTPQSMVTRIDYDAAGRILARTDPGGGIVRRVYSAAGRPTEYTDQHGETSRLEYDEFGRLVRRIGRGGAVTTIDYDEAGRIAATRGPDGATTRLRHDALDRIIEARQPDAGKVRYEYDRDGNLTVEEGPEGVTRRTWDGRRNMTTLTEPDGAVYHYEHDELGRVVQMTDPVGEVWRTHYDDAHRTVIHEDPLGGRTTVESTGSGRVRAVTDPLGRRTEHHYDAAGRLTLIIDPEGGRTRFHHDGDGRLLLQTTPGGLTTRYEYEHNRLAAVVDPRGWITRFRYDDRGNRTAVIRPSGAKFCYIYDRDNRLVETRDPHGGVTRYEYDDTGNLVAAIDAKGAVTRFRHDRAGRRIETTDPLGRTTRYEYDRAGNLTAIHEPTGRTVRLKYDAAGRLIRRTGQDGSQVRFTYDKAGRRVSMVDGTGRTSYEYDKAGRLTTVTYPDGGKLVASYDKAGQRTSLRYPDGSTVEYRYDLNGRLVGLRDFDAGEAVFAVDPDGRLITEQLPGGWSRRYDYDGGLLVGFQESRSNVPVTTTRLRRDPDGRVVEQDDTGVLWRYGYDRSGRLVSVSSEPGPDGPVAVDVHLAYDIAGNRTSMVGTGLGGDETVAVRYLYDVADQLVAVESGGRRIDYRYDESGRLVEEYDGEVRHRLHYDEFGQPRELVRSRAWAVERLCPRFDGDGLLARLTLRTGDDNAPKTRMRYRWIPDQIPELLTQCVDTDVPPADHTAPLGRDLATARFTYGYGRIFATTAYDSVIFARDVHGSALRTEATRPWALAETYDVFGLADGLVPGRAPLLAAEIPRFGYRGELGYGSMLNLRARIYDAALGRFRTRDPLSLPEPGGVLVKNPYAYAGNDPLNQIDPLGTEECENFSYAAGDRGPIWPLGAPCSACRNPGNGYESHLKCFQGKACLATRGYIPSEAIDGDEGALRELWHRRRRECTAQAMAIHRLNENRRSFFDLGTVNLSENVDWEVGHRGSISEAIRMDILTEERHLFEVKRWTGPATRTRVQAQLQGYLYTTKLQWDLDLDLSEELGDWADCLEVTQGFFTWPWNRDFVFVWGLGNDPGHVYFAQNDRASDEVRAQGHSRRLQREMLQFPFPLPLPIRVPVPLRLP